MFICCQQSYYINSHDFHWGCVQPSFGRRGTAIWSPVGVMGVRKHSMYRRCLQLAWWRMDRSSVLERAYCPTSAQCPQVGAFRFSHQTLFFIKCKVQTPSLMWLNKRVCFVLTSHERNMARSKRLFTTSCTMKCCESGSAMLKDIIHKQMKMFWENFSLQL